MNCKQVFAALALFLASPALAQLPLPAMRAALPQLAGHKCGQLELRFTAPGGSWLELSEEGGWLIRFDHDELPAEVESELRWDEKPEPPTPADVPVRGIIRGKQIIIELP